MDEMFENLGSMAKMIGGDADVGPDRVAGQSFRIMAQVGLKKASDGGANAVDNGAEIVRLIGGRPLELIEGGPDGAAASMAKDNHEPGAELFGGKFDASNLGWSDNIPGDADHEKIPETLVKDDFHRDARVGASENDGKRILAVEQIRAA